MSNTQVRRTGTLKSITSLGGLISSPPVNRKALRRYSWLPDVIRVEGSVIAKILGPVLTVTIFATVIAYLSIEYGYNLRLTNNVVPLLSVVVGLILVFRNSTSYDRYWEGRKDFSQMLANVRSLTRLIWVNVNNPPAEAKGKNSATLAVDATVQSLNLKADKVRAMRLCVSFAFAVKHHLRAEFGTDYPDLIGVLPAEFARFDQTGWDRTFHGVEGNYGATAGTPGSHNPPLDEETGQQRHHHHHHASGRINVTGTQATLPNDHSPLLAGNDRRVEYHAYSSPESFPLPLIISHELTRSLYKWKRSGTLETVGPAGTNAMFALVTSMVDQLTAMERVANTPIPVSYSIHLKQCVTLYLFSLPFTLISDLGYRMIPIVTVVAFTLMGIEGIADEIEMPFGRDQSDLPLDRYCDELRDEVEYTVARLQEGVHDDPFAESSS